MSPRSLLVGVSLGLLLWALVVAAVIQILGAP
jgi:hypothetical protein